jgi:hypothetical protein
LRRIVFNYSTLGERPMQAGAAYRTVVREEALAVLLARNL